MNSDRRRPAYGVDCNNRLVARALRLFVCDLEAEHFVNVRINHQTILWKVPLHWRNKLGLHCQQC